MGRARRLARRRDRAVPRDPGRRRLLAARGRQLHGALRDAAAEGRRRRAPALRAGPDPATAGTPTTSRPTCCSTTCSATATTTPTRPGATRRCATSRRARCCRPGYAGMIVLAAVPAVWRRVMDQRVRRPLRRRRVAGQHQPAQARDVPRAVRRRRSQRRRRAEAADDRGRTDAGRRRCWQRAARAASTSTRSRPVTSTRASRPVRPGRTSPSDWCCPDCGVREKVDFVPCPPERSVV